MKAEEIDALENETKELTEERAGLIAAAEKRNGILDNIAKGGGVSIRSFGKKEEGNADRSSKTFPAENRGLNTVINGDKKAEGSISIGMVIPDKTPNSVIAASYPLPARIRIRGIKIILAEEISLPSSVDSDTGTATEAISLKTCGRQTPSLPVSFLRRKRYSVVRKVALTISLKIMPQTINAAA